MKRSKMIGYNSNKFVKAEHIFTVSEGTWFFSKKDAVGKLTGNEVRCYFEEKIIDNETLFRHRVLNVWN